MVHNFNLGRSSTCPISPAVHPGRCLGVLRSSLWLWGDRTPRSDLASKLPCLRKVAPPSDLELGGPGLPAPARLNNPRQETGLASSSVVARVTILSRCPTSMPLTLPVPVASRRQAGWLGTRETGSGSPNTSDDACSLLFRRHMPRS
jgi:hypothetical protein